MISLDLVPLEGTFAVCRLAPGDSIPDWTASSTFCSITRTGEEISILCHDACVPAAVRAERDWRGLRVAGTLDFAEVGVLASLLVPLAEAGISVFVLSTFDTDYLMIRGSRYAATVQTLRTAGHRVAE